MTQSNDGGTVEKIVNTVMGVKTDNKNQPLASQKYTTTEFDIRATLIYKVGTIAQIALMVLALAGMDKLIDFINSSINTNSSLPGWINNVVAGLFLAFLSLRSRLFSPLDNTRSRTTYSEVIRPKWAPPPLAFPIVWMSIAVLRVISSLLIWQQLQQHFLVLPLIAFVVHLAVGDTWNTIFTVEKRLGAAVPVVILGPWLSSLIVTFIYWQTNPLAGIILAPSCIWLTVATLLVLSIWQLNGKEPLYPLKLSSVSE